MAFCQNEAAIVTMVHDDIYNFVDFARIYVRSLSTQIESHVFKQGVPMTMDREVPLSSGRRMDVYGRGAKGRAHWIIEFKQHGSTDALVQLEQYVEELDRHIRLKEGRKFFWIQKTLIAKTFDRDALYLATRLGVQVVQFNQYTAHDFTMVPIVDMDTYARPNTRRKRSHELLVGAW